MHELTNNTTNWDQSFFRIKKFFLFFIVAAFIIGNIIDIVSPKEGLSENITILNSIYIGLALLWLLLYFLKALSFNITALLSIYSLLLNMLISLAISTNELDFEIYYMREMMILGILLIPTGLILNKIHVLIFSSAIFVLYTCISFCTNSPFLHNNYIILLAALLGYTFWVYFIILTLENWSVKQNNLVNTLKQQNESLNTKSKELDQINKTKDRIFSILAHDLKNPFNSIIGFSDLLLLKYKSFDDAKTERYLNIINHSASESEALLQNIYTWATTQTNDIGYNPTDLNIEKLINNLLAYFRPNLESKEITLEADYNKVSKITADGNMLSTIIRNLVSNALKYSPRRGKINITINDAETHLLFCISDNGVGISEENIALLFDNKRVVQTTGTEEEKGTGLGLVICKEFVERHSGKIWVESKVNKGASFYFTIPKTT